MRSMLLYASCSADASSDREALAADRGVGVSPDTEVLVDAVMRGAALDQIPRSE
jgi:hypothetical protein